MNFQENISWNTDHSTQYSSLKQLRLSWKNISLSVKKKKEGTYLREFVFGRQIENIHLLNGGRFNNLNNEAMLKLVELRYGGIKIFL